MNGDGRPDIVGADPASSLLRVWLANGQGSFSAPVNLSSAIVTGLAVADVNRDGAPDLAGFPAMGGSPTLYTGDGRGAFTQVARALGTIGPGANLATAGDVNGDGNPDLLVSLYEDTGHLGLFLGRGDGTFQTPASIFAVPEMVDVLLRDLDGDGKLDLAVTSFRSAEDTSTSKGLIALRGRGDGTFAPTNREPIQVQPGARTIGSGDLNCDGVPDLVTSSSQSPDLSLLVGKGQALFMAPQRIQVGQSMGSVLVVDVQAN